MTDQEASKWRNFYKTTGVFPWVTSAADVEGYFCEVPYLMALFQISQDEADLWRNEAAKTVGKAHETFLEKRKSIVRAVWPNGGSPDAEQMWQDAGGKTPDTVKGKKLLAALKMMAKSKDKDDKLLDAFTIPSSFEMATDLKKVIEAVVEGNPASEVLTE